MYTLYGIKGSGSAAIELALEAAHLPFQIVRAASWEADSALAELESLNPLKQIPTLVLPDGSVMTKSPILPTDAAARAQAPRGLVYIAANCYCAVSVTDFPIRK